MIYANSFFLKYGPNSIGEKSSQNPGGNPDDILSKSYKTKFRNFMKSVVYTCLLFKLDFHQDFRRDRDQLVGHFFDRLPPWRFFPFSILPVPVGCVRAPPVSRVSPQPLQPKSGVYHHTIPNWPTPPRTLGQDFQVDFEYEKKGQARNSNFTTF